VPAVRVAALGELPAGGLRRVDVDGTAIVLARVGDAVYACGGVCPHQGGPLTEGRLSGTRLACPWHGWTYDVRTGVCLLPTRGARVSNYPVRVDGGQVWVEVGS
jgi:nitrite reductase (NADH) small subunit/3-phenylpropionate/trans-cinnamate dioxygenase ferredoxin subunit